MVGRTLVFAMIAVALSAPRAGADGTKSIEAFGVEVEVPADWIPTTKGELTVIAPKKFKSRAIEIAAASEMPAANVASIETFLGSAKYLVKITTVKAIDRYGVKVISAAGTMSAGGKERLELELLAIPQPVGATLVMSFIKAHQDPVLRKANEDILASVRVAGPKLKVSVTPTKTKGKGAPKEFEEFITSKAAELDKLLLLPRPLPILFVDCGQPNAFYTPAKHDIRICHELFDSLLDTFSKAGLDDKRAHDVLIGAITFTFFHEFGHALVGELGLPITGKGEDAADEISVLMLIALNDKRAAFDAGFWFESMVEQGITNPFYDDHSFNQQRAIDIWCLLYGADQTTYGPFLTKMGVPATRLLRCKSDYVDRKKAWGLLLDSHRRHGAKAKK